MVSLWLAVAVFYAAVLLVGLGVMTIATGSSVVLALRRDRPPLRGALLAVAALLVAAGAAAVGLALLWFGRDGADVVQAALSLR